MTPAPLIHRLPDTPAPFAPGEYLTDGRRLFRVVSRLDPRAAYGFAVLEDCLTLEVNGYSPDDLVAMDLRTVARTREEEPAPAGVHQLT